MSNDQLFPAQDPQHTYLLFDFDGTIADSFAVLLEIFHELTNQSLDEDPDKIAYLRQLPVPKVIKELKVPPLQIPRLIVKGRKMMGQHIHEIPLIEGMDTAIEKLYAHGFHLFITSSNSPVNVKAFLKAKQLDGYFEKVYGGIGLFNKAGAIKRIMRQNRLQGELVIYIGDEARDVEAARRAGVAMAAVGWGINDPRLLALHHPNIIADSPQKLYNILIDPKKGPHSWKKL